MNDNKTQLLIKKRVEGQLPQKREVGDWGEVKLMQFLTFVDFFTREGKFSFNAEIIATAAERAGEEEYWQEFLWRINMFPGENGGTARKFGYRFLAFSRVPLAWMKSNPHAVTLDMFAIMEKNPRMQWACKNFKIEETDIGAKIVVMDNDETTDPGRKNVAPTVSDVQTPMVKFEQAKLNMLTMLQALSKSIPQAELRNMSVKDRIAAFDKLLNTAHKVMTRGDGGTKIFTQININKAGREELEKSFLAYSENET